MFNFLDSKFNLEKDFVISQVEEGTISNCISEQLYQSVVEMQSQDAFTSIDDLKAEIDLAFIENLGNEAQLLEDIKHVVTLLECIASRSFNDFVAPDAIVLSDSSVISKLYNLVDSSRINNRFCDRFDADSILVKLKNKPRKLWGKLLFEGTNTILFSDNGVGKTQLSMIVADGIARGFDSILGLEVEASPMSRIVLYYDFEMTEDMLLKRFGFSEPSDATGISSEKIREKLPHFIRIDNYSLYNELLEFGYDVDVLDNSSKIDQVLAHIDKYVEHNSSYNIVTVIDNITSLSTKTEDNGAAQSLMNKFNELKQKHGSRITNLILAHTPKVSYEQPLRKEHLKGAKSLSDFADEVIGLKQSSQGEDIFYLKQLKGRVDGIEYDEDNVLVFNRFETDSGVLSLDIKGTDNEFSHIRTEEARKAEIELANADLYEKVGEAFNVSFKVLEDFPSNIGIDERSEFIFNASEVSTILFQDSAEDFSSRLISKVMTSLGVVYKTSKIDGNKTKKGYLLERLTQSA